MPDSTYNTADTDDANLQNFFERPIKVHSFAWTPGADIFETINPWKLYFENTRVINRITNFNLLRCKLKCKILLNGNGFYYGRAIASYNPLHNSDNFTVNRQLFSQDIIAASQRPHVYLDPTNSQGGSLTLPFFWYKNALKIPDQDWREMGEMNIRSIQNLKHANGSNDPITLSVFVWAEDVNLSIPTANEPGALAPQMGVKDEYGAGPISRPAGFIAKVAGQLSVIPVIAPYAKATQLAASTVVSIAQMFGFSRPAVLADIVPYRPTYVGNMSNTNVPDSTTKLTLDCKAEVTIDPRVVGLGSADELSIQSIACRESWLTSFPWAITATSEEMLWNSEVSPLLWDKNADEIHLPACAFAALPFLQWRGTMKFRFQIVASTFHKGRIKISYDPSYPLTNEYNTNYIYVVDLAKERDFTIDIGWGQPYSMVGHRNPLVDSVPFRTTPLGADPEDKGNGIISVYVVNELTSPNSTPDNDVSINVFVSMGDDFEVFNPDSEILQDTVFFDPQVGEVFSPQMGEANVPDADMTTSENEPMKTDSSDQKGATLSDNDNTVHVYYGDPIVSFRQCLKRYNYSKTFFPSTTGAQYFSWIASNMPLYRGYAPDAYSFSNQPVYPTPYNYSVSTLLNWLTPAFTARRGALRWKYMRTGGTTDDLMYLTRTGEPGVVSQYLTDTMSGMDASEDTRMREATQAMQHTWDGSHATHGSNNPVIEAEIPWYTNLRFAPAKDSSPNSPSLPFYSDTHTISGTWDVQTSNTPALHAFVSTGEDFSLYFFTGCPRVWYQDHVNQPTTF